MKFYLSKEFSQELYYKHEGMQEIGQSLYDFFLNKNYGDIDEIYLTVIGVAPEFESFSIEMKKFKRTKKSIELSLKGNYPELMNENNKSIYDCILRVPQEIRNLKVKAFDFDRFEEDVNLFLRVFS